MPKTQCLDCGKEIKGTSQSSLCHACAARRFWRRKGMRQKIVARITEAMNRPETIAKLKAPKSPDALARIAASHRTPESRAKRSALTSGEKNYFYGKPGTNLGKFGPEHPMFGHHFKKKNPLRGIEHPYYGKKLPFETCLKKSQARVGKYRGAENPNWKGGQKPDPYDHTFTYFIKKQVRERDG